MDRQRRRVQRECDRLNRERHVTETNHYSLRHFFSAAGNTMISFGSANDRYQALISLISTSAVPIVILNGDVNLEAVLYSYFKEGHHGTFVRFSDESPRYNIFYRMTNQQIINYIRAVASNDGYINVKEIAQYTTGFLEILNTYVAHVSLSSMKDMLGYTDQEIISFGRQKHVSENAINMIMINAGAGHNLRIIIDRILDAFSHLTQERCRGHFNLLSPKLTRHDVTLINVRSHDPFIVNHYFESELRLSTTNYHLVVNEIDLLGNDGLREAIEYRSQIQRVTLISHNVVGMMSGIDHLHQFTSELLFTTDFAAIEGQQLLEQYGHYQYHFPTRTQMHQPRLIDLIPGTQTLVNTEDRLRVRLIDLNGFKALLSHGLTQDVYLVRELRQ